MSGADRGPSAPAEAVPADSAAGAVFGSRLGLAHQYVDLLGTVGVERGLIGPREVDRLWARHVLNCAVVGELIGPGESVLDVGSGAGLPGLPLALARPDLHVTLLEPMARRVAFLEEALAGLGLGRVRVVRGRAEDVGVRRGLGRFPVVTARAVAPLARLAGWCLPLLSPGGQLLAFKGRSASDEVAAAGAELRGADVSLLQCGVGVVADPVTVVRVVLPA